VIESAFQLQAASADIFKVVTQQADRTLGGDLRARFFDFLIFHQHFAREDESLRPLARGGQTALNQKLIESDFQSNIFKTIFARGIYPESASTRSSAKC